MNSSSTTPIAAGSSVASEADHVSDTKGSDTKGSDAKNLDLDETESPYPSIPTTQYHRIIHQLEALEKLHDIKILYAVENGSRLTGLWHDESDFDIRFVFQYNRKIFNTTNGRKMMDLRDTVEGFTADKMLDWQGWCVDKAIDALKSSNPSIIEWINSDITYINRYKFASSCKILLGKMHNVKSLYYHYLNMAKKNWDTFIKDQKQILYKKYLYVMRPILMLIYIQSDNYDELKIKAPIVNDFYKLLDIISAMYPCHEDLICSPRGSESEEFDSKELDSKKSDPNKLDDLTTEGCGHPYRFTSELLIELSLLIDMKKQNKGYEGVPLLNLNHWIQRFFEYEDERMNSQNTKRTDQMVFQALQSTREKVQNELRKVNALGNKNGMVNRNDYLSMFGQYTMYMWLIQHPGKHSGEAPQNINNLLKEISIDPSLSEWIREVSTTKTEAIGTEHPLPGAEQSLPMNPVRSIGQIRADVTGLFLRHLKEFLVQHTTSTLPSTSVDTKEMEDLHQLMTWIEGIESGLMNGKSITRDDLIDYCFRNYVSLMWLIKSEQNARNIPKDIFSDRDTYKVLPQCFVELSRNLASGLRPIYMVKTNKYFHEVIQKDLTDNEEYVSKMCAKYSRKKEIDKQAMFKGSFQTVDTTEFLDLLEKYL